MKKSSLFCVGLSVIMIMLVFVGCGGENAKKLSNKNINVADVAKKIVNDLKISDMVEVSEDNINTIYDFDLAKVEKYSVYYSGVGSIADEIAVFKLRNKDDVEKLVSMFNNRKKTVAGNFEGYAPDEVAKAESAVVKTNGNYVLFAIVKDNSKAKEIFDKSF